MRELIIAGYFVAATALLYFYTFDDKLNNRAVDRMGFAMLIAGASSTVLFMQAALLSVITAAPIMLMLCAVGRMADA